MCILVCHTTSRSPSNKASSRMATDTGFAAGAGGRGTRHGMKRVFPFKALDVRRGSVMALPAGAFRETDGDGVGIAQHAEAEHVLAAGAVAVFTLDVRQVGQRRVIGLHAGPVAIGQDARERPAQRFRNVVETTVDGVGVGVIPDGMAVNAILAVMAALN